jgi:hypothetical protein
MVDPKRSDYMRQYMREYMRQRRGSSVKLARKDPEIGPPCPPNLPSGDVSTSRLTAQSRLFKAHLAFALSQKTKIYEEMNLKAETFYTESLEYQVQLTELEAEVKELKARIVELESRKPATPAETLPPAQKPLATDDQYLVDKAAGLVDPNRRPKDAYDEILL